jgi:hypothetical protein
VVIKFSTPKEATMYRRKHRILKSLVLGFAVAALAAPTALAEPRGPGNSPRPDFWNYEARTGEKVADTSPGLAPTDLSRMYGQGSSPGPANVGLSPDDRALFRGVEPSSVPVSVTVSSDSDGFQWRDAGLGAASTLTLVLLLGAATLVIRHQRRRIAAF